MRGSAEQPLLLNSQKRQQMDDEGFESTFIETLITQEKGQTYVLSLPAPNPLSQQPDYSLVRTLKRQLTKSNCVYRKQFGQGRTITIAECQQQPTIKGDLFDSNFISGNLSAAYQISQYEYDLIVQEDINTSGYAQWFYFRVNNQREQTFQFNIINLTKFYQQYKNGYTVYVKEKDQWQLLQTQVLVKQNMDRYTITFWVTKQLKKFEIALGIPYTHLDLDAYLLNNNIQSSVIATSLSGLPIKMLSFGSKRSDVILVIARQHPGETVSSHVCQGFIDQMMQDKTLQLFYNVIVIPMINPDGVKWGNFRCDLSGRDLNRVWLAPSRYYQQIIAIRQLINQILEEGRDIKSFVDLHGHSKKLGAFMYACRNPEDPIECRVLPKIMANQCKYFDFDSCTYSLQPYKLKTARAYVFTQVQNQRPNNFHNIITLETSFFGYKQNNKFIQYNLDDLHQIGRDLHQSLKMYYIESENTNKIKNSLEKQKMHYQELDLRAPEEESDSDPEEGFLSDEELNRIFVLESPQKKSSFLKRGKSSEQKSRKLKQKIVNPFLVGQCDKQSYFHIQTRLESRSHKVINQTLSPQTPSVKNLNKVNRNLSSHNKQTTHMHSTNADPQEQVQSSRILRPSRTLKEFKLKQEQRLFIPSPNDRHLLFEQSLKVKRKNTQTIKLF